MKLDRDEFIVKFDKSQIGENDLIAIIEKAGYTASIVKSSGTTLLPGRNADSRNDPIFVDALARAKRENKPLVIDFYAHWCLPCLKMLETTIPDANVAALLKKCVYLEVDTDKHPELAKSFDVVGLPDIRFLAPDGSEIKQIRGYQDADTFTGELKKMRNALPPENGKQPDDASVSLINLSEDARELRSTFNAGKGRVRLLLIVSPG